MKQIEEIKIILLKQGIWLSVAESLTCGKLQSIIGEVTGVSGCFRGGITAYSIDEKVKFLNVDGIEAKKVNCVSQRVAFEMAKGVSEMFNSEIGIGTTGYAEACKIENKAQQAYFAIYEKNGNSEKYDKITKELKQQDISRSEFQSYVVNAVIKELLTYLRNKYCQE